MRHTTIERGQIGLEYAGVAVLIAGVVAAIALTMSTTDIQARVCRAVSDILSTDLGCSAGPADEQEPPPEQTFEPEKCKIHQTGDKYSGAVKIGFIKIGENAGFVVTEYSDGSVTMMATNGGEIGATGGFGADVAWSQMEAAAKVDFGGGLKFDYGSTWHFEDMPQAEQFRGQLDDYLFDQWSLTHPVCSPMGACFPRPINGAEPPPVPSTTFGGVQTTGEVSGKLGIDATTGTAPLTQAQMTDQGFVAKLSGASKWTVTNDNGGTADDPADDTRTYVTDLSLNSELTGQIMLATGGTGSLLGVSYSVKQDAQGNIVQVKIASTAEVTSSTGGTGTGKVTQGSGDDKSSGGGSVSASTTTGDVVVTETTLSLDPTDQASQQIVTDWMGGSGGHAWPGLIKVNTIDPSTADPNDPFSQLMHDKALSSTIAYDHVTDKAGFALNVKFGLAFGVDFSMQNDETTAVAATYLGPPGADGVRPDLDYTACVK